MRFLALRGLGPLLAAFLALTPLHTAVPGLQVESGQVAQPPAQAGAEPLTGGAHFVPLELAELRGTGRLEGLLAFTVGSVHEPAGRTGLLEVLAAALRSGGSVLYDGKALDAWLQRHAATLEIVSGPNGLQIVFSVPADQLDGLLQRVGSLLTTPSYQNPEVNAARERVLERLAGEQDDPQVRAEHALREVALGSACAWARCASPAEVRSVTRGEVLGFHRAHLGPANLWFGLAHGGDAAPARAAIERMVAALPRATSPIAPERPAFVATKPGPIVLVDQPAATRVELRAAVPAPVDADQAAALGLWLEALELAGDEDQALSAARGLVEGLRFESLHASRSIQPLGWIASGRATVEQAPAALAALIELFAGDLKRPVSAALLERVRGAEPDRGAARTSLRERVLDAAAGIAPEARAQAWHAQRAIATEVVQRAVRTRLPTRPPVLVVVGPARQLVDPLEQLAPVLLLSGQADPQGTPEGLALRARVLEAVGGTERWSRLGGVALSGDVTYKGSERSVPLRLWRDLLGRRLRLEHTQAGVRTTIVVTPQAGWSRAIQAVYDLPREQWERTLYRERRQLVRVLYDLASDPRLEARRGQGGRLEIHSGQGLVCWIELDSLDRPARLGYTEPRGETALYVFADWSEEQGYQWPARVTQPQDGTVFRWSRFAPSAALDGELFERPVR